MTAKPKTGAGALLERLGVDEEFIADLENKIERRTIGTSLKSLRVAKNISQQHVADVLGITQSAVSKMEYKDNDQMTLCEYSRYLNAIGESMTVHFGKPMTNVEKIKMCAFEIRDLLDELAEQAGSDEDITKGVQDFWLETVLNIGDLLARSKAVPVGAFGKIITEDAPEPILSFPLDPCAPEEVSV